MDASEVSIVDDWIKIMQNIYTMEYYSAGEGQILGAFNYVCNIRIKINE